MTPNYDALVAVFLDHDMRLKDKERILSNLGRNDYISTMWRKDSTVWIAMAQERTRVLLKRLGTKKTKWISTDSIRRDYEEVK